LGAGCKYKRENKCKYFHPTASTNAKKVSKSIEISDYSIENENELDADCENVFEPEIIKDESKLPATELDENDEAITSGKN
jgi:hypothetical protein